MIAISNLKLAPGADEAALATLAARALNDAGRRTSPPCASAKSRSTRAEKDDIHYVYTVGVTVRGDERNVSSAAAAAPPSCRTRPTPSPHRAAGDAPRDRGLRPGGDVRGAAARARGRTAHRARARTGRQDAQCADRGVSRGRAVRPGVQRAVRRRAARARSPTASSTPARTTRASASCSRSLRRTARRSTSPTTPSPTSARTCSSRSCRISGVRSSTAAARCASATAMTGLSTEDGHIAALTVAEPPAWLHVPGAAGHSRDRPQRARHV